MARGINKVILVGNLGQDPESRQFDNGGSVTNITVATSETWKDKQTGQAQERTEWNRVSFFGKLAEIAAQYLQKGSKVYIEGSLRTRKYQGQDGQDRYVTEIIANNMQMLDGRGDQGSSQQSRPAPQQDYRGHSRSNQPNPTYGNSAGGSPDDFDSDVPF